MQTIRIKGTTLALAASLGLVGLTPAVSFAELESELTIATIHLHRGMNESGGPALLGEINYNTEVGVYAGAEISNTLENNAEAEVSLTAGYKRAFGEFSFGLGYTEYTYPGAFGDCDEDPATPDEKCSWMDMNEGEYFINLGFAGFSLGAFIGTDSEEKARYYSLNYHGENFGVHVGSRDHADPMMTYTDFNVHYNLTDALTVTVSVASGDMVDDPNSEMSEGPLFVLSYEVPLGGKGGHPHEH